MEISLTVVLATIVTLGVFSQWLAWRLNLPAIVLFVCCGLLVGPVFGFIEPAEDIGRLMTPLVELAVAIILFEGGMTLHWHELQQAAHGVRRLVSIGSLVTWVLTAFCAHFIGALEWPVSIVLGAILIVTGPTVILPMLRQASLNSRTASYLKWEGIINDPIGALLAVVVFQYFIFSSVGADKGHVFVELGWAVVTALILGIGVAWALAGAFNRTWVPEYLKAPMTFAMVILVYVIANSIFDEAGLLAVTVMGMAMGNMKFAGMVEIRRFKEYITVMMVSMVFVVLTADLDPQVLKTMDWHSVLFVAAVIFLVRPLSVFISTLFSPMLWKDRLLVGWIAPRGVVASAMAGVFGDRLVAAGYLDAELLLPLIFSVVFATVILHSFTIGFLSRRMGLAARPHGALIVGASPWSTELARVLTEQLDIQVLLVDSSWHRLRQARLAGVRVLYGEILSKPVQQSLELNEISCLLAATSNDAYNALVCSNFVGNLEHDRVYQLAMYNAEEKSDGPFVVDRPMRGRQAFSKNAQYEELGRCHYLDWNFKITQVTDTYSYEDFLEEIPPQAIVIATKSPQGGLMFRAADGGKRPGPGTTVVYYAPKTAPEAATIDASQTQSAAS